MKPINFKFFIAVAVALMINQTAAAQIKKFNIKNYQWLVGHWIGDGFGGVSEEVWAPAANGVMMGMYRNILDGKVKFYEFIILSESGMSLKHFNSDLVGWEDKEEMVNFQLLDYDENNLIFDALKIIKIDDDNIQMELNLSDKDSLTVEVFKFTRKK